MDNGNGMTQEKINMLLYQTSEQHSRAGTGIGLNYVRRIIKRTYNDQATITIQSVINKGTKVTLQIPITKGSE